MARVSFGKTSLGPLRSPVAPAMQKALTANPMLQAVAALKQPPEPKPPKLALPKQSRKRSQFFGE